MSARRTIMTALMAGGVAVGAAAPALADAEAAAVPLSIMQDDDEDDNGRAPAGGVDAGQGGTADGFEFLLPLSLLGGGAAAAAGAVLLRRRLAGQGG